MEILLLSFCYIKTRIGINKKNPEVSVFRHGVVEAFALLGSYAA
jgi:hypothetical protein